MIVRRLKRVRNRFLDNVLMQQSTFRKSIYRLRQQENTFAYVAKDRNGSLFLYAPTDSTIGAALDERGSWQYDELNHYIDYVAEKARGKRAYFFDIGANIGTQTVYAARSGMFAKVFAVEAMPYNFELLNANVTLNGCTETTICLNRALGAENRQARFLFNPLNPGGSRLDDGSSDCDETLMEVVKTSTLVQGLFRDHGEPEVLVFWIDVEGMEEEVVRDLQEVCVNREAYFCIEYNKGNYDPASGSQLTSWIETREEVYVLSAGGLQPVETLSGVAPGQDIVFAAGARAAPDGQG